MGWGLAPSFDCALVVALLPRCCHLFALFGGSALKSFSKIEMIVGPERSYWILHHDHWNEEALRTFLLRKKRELVSVWQPLKKEG